MSQIEIQILHQDYLLTCPDGQENQLLEAVERVDQQFQHMRNTSKLRSRERVGVLLAVNLAYENLELRKQLQALQQQLADVQELGDAGLPDIAEPDPLLLALQAQAEHHADHQADQHFFRQAPLLVAGLRQQQKKRDKHQHVNHERKIHPQCLQ